METKFTLYADIINGVKLTGDDSFVTDIVDQDDFINSLDQLGPDDYLKSEVSLAYYEDIDAEYGIY